MKNIRKRRISETGKKELTRTISDILREKEYILFAYIFGSFISEDIFEDIDVGIFVSGERLQSTIKLELETENELEDFIHIPVDIRIINNAPLSFVYNMLKSGIVIVDKDKLLRADFEGLIYKKYFDFQHLRREYLREILNAPV